MTEDQDHDHGYDPTQGQGHPPAPYDPNVAALDDPHAHSVFDPITFAASPFEPRRQADTFDPSTDTAYRTTSARSQLGTGYHGEYHGVAGCWYSRDGYVYDPAGNRLGLAGE